MAERLPPPPKPRAPAHVPFMNVPNDTVGTWENATNLADMAKRTGPPQLIITANITIPATPGYARRLGRLLESLRKGIEEEAPWLDNVTIDVRR